MIKNIIFYKNREYPPQKTTNNNRTKNQKTKQKQSKKPDNVRNINAHWFFVFYILINQ